MRRAFVAFVICASSVLAVPFIPHQAAVRTATRANQSSGIGVAIQTLTYAEMLSLSPSTPVGTRVNVTDGFVVSGLGAPYDGFYARNGSATLWGLTAPRYTQYPSGAFEVIASSPNATQGLQPAGGNGDGDIVASAPWGDGDGNTPPWTLDWSPATLTHPAVQSLAAPSTAQGGVFVSGGTQDGIYPVNGTNEGKERFTLLGTSDNDEADGTLFYTGNLNDLLGDPFPTSPGWILRSVGFTPLYYSLSDVATPDLATNWKNASDDSPAAITVTPVTQGSLTAGLRDGDDTYAVNGNLNGRQVYHDVLGVLPDFTWDGTKWTNGTTDGVGNTAQPWEAGIGVQDNVADSGNWEENLP